MTTITIVGLGPGPADDLSRRAWRILMQADTVYLRTERHPCVPDLPAGPRYINFDEVYERAESFDAVYDAITQVLLTAAQSTNVVYAVPGDPSIAESTTQRVRAAAAAAGVGVQIISGISFIEPTLALVAADGIERLQIHDAVELAAMHHPPINPDAPALIGQVYSQQVASDLKLTLMNEYPDELPVKLVHAAGTAQALVEDLPLYAIDRSAHISHMTALYVPVYGQMRSFEQFQEIIAHLRAPEGCPWDRKQTHESLRPYLIEEAYEVLEAIDSGDTQALYEELGDLMLQIVLHTQIAVDEGEFAMGDVMRTVSAKMIRRHPHVWGETVVDGADAVVVNWEALKQQEKAENGTTRESRLDGVPRGLPALMQAHTFQRKAAKVGFDWNDMDGVTAKLHEEIAEVIDAKTDAERVDEVGDLLFMVVNWARWLGVTDPENALRQANAKFYRRFRFVEQAIASQSRPMEDYSLEELDALWNRAKAEGL